MAQKDDKKEIETVGKIVPRNITTEMKESYLDYAMSVIASRALPDVRDGLKPVHRRILYAMSGLGLTHAARFRKSAAVVGEVLGKYHPHGDTSVYDALVKMAQEFSHRYPLILGQGNFGCFTKDTKVRLADGRSLSFEDLVKEEREGKRNYTFTVHDDHKIGIARIINPRITKKNTEIIKVILDNDREIKCTPDHKFLLKDGTYIEAKNLKQGDSLMPLYTRLSDSKDISIPEMKGYEMVLQPNLDEWAFVHHLADQYNLDNEVYEVRDGRVRHHKDFDKLNNNPENIQRMQWKDHWKLHSRLASARHKNDTEYVKSIAKGRREFWNKTENRQKYSERISRRNLDNWKKPEYREKMRAFLSDVNTAYIKAHPEKRIEFSERMTRTLKKMWQTEEYKQLMHEKIIKGNKNHTTNKTGKVKFDKICQYVLQSGGALSKNAYEKARLEVYSYKAATNWETGLSKYYAGNIKRALTEISGNHKVKEIVFFNEKKEDVYDLTINGTHNFSLDAGVFVHNSVDGDSAAAMRYTEAKMSRLSGELLRDLDKETVEWRPNYDNTKKEPSVLPAVVPNLLLNGTLGIAVGMATNIPPHNISEVVDATMHLIDEPDATVEDLLKYVQGPDFPTGGVVFNVKDVAHAYATGRGGVVVRGEAEIVEGKGGMTQIVVTSLPYRVNKAELVVRIATLVRDKKIDGIKGLRDESARGETRVVVDLKQGSHPQKILNYLYKHTDLENMFHYNMLALVDGVPRVLSLKAILKEFIGHREVVVRKRTEFELKRAEERAHILTGLKKALDNIDKIIKTIKSSADTPTAHKNLVKTFKFSDAQASAILEMKLQKLAGLERKNIELELKEKIKLIADLKALLGSAKKILGVIKNELAEIKKTYGDERRTRVVKGGVKMLSMEDIIPDEETVVVLTKGGYIKRTNPSEYRRQKRGGIGVHDLNTKEEDFITMLLTATTHNDVLFFTNTGKVYQSKMYEIPEGKRVTKGKSIMNFLPLAQGEEIASVLALPKTAREIKDLSLAMVTKNGIIKKASAQSFLDVRRSGIIALKLKKGDALLSSLLVEKGDTIVLASAKGQAIRFKESDARVMGRAAAGVRAMKLRSGDVVVGADVVSARVKESYLLSVAEKGYGKRTPLEEYKIQRRGGSGVKTAKINPKTGPLIVAKVVTAEDEEIVVISKQSQVIRVGLKEISSLGRQTQGVRVMKLRDKDSIATFICL